MLSPLRLLGGLLAVLPTAQLGAAPEPADGEHQDRTDQGSEQRDVVEAFGAELGLEIALHHRIGRDHLTHDPAEQRGAGPDQDREAVEQRHDQRSAGDDQRNADGKADHQQRHVALGGGRDRDHVVEAHDDIGDGDDLHRPPQMLGRLALAFVLVFRNQEFGRDIEQRHAADDLEIGQRQQRRDEHREDDAQQHRHAGAQHHAPHPLTVGQSAARHRDDHRVIAREQDVDPHDLEERDPELGLAHLVPAARDHADPAGRIQRVFHRTHSPGSPRER